MARHLVATLLSSACRTEEMFTNRLNSVTKCGILARMSGNGVAVLGATNALRLGEARSSSKASAVPPMPPWPSMQAAPLDEVGTAKAIGNCETVFPTS
jgi:hypothetical protein